MATSPKPQQSFDRVPPQNIDAERSVLGAMMLNPDVVGTGIEILRDNPAEVFYSRQHQLIYEAILNLFRRNVPVDAVTLVEQLNRDGSLEDVGGASYVADLTGAVPTSANIEYYAKIVMDAAVLRRVITTCTRVANEAYSPQDDVNMLLDQAEADIFAIAEARQLSPIYSIADLLTESILKIEQIIKSRQGYTGLPTGYHRLDEMLSGLQPSDMIILAARPSVGKTAFALNVASNIATIEKKAVLLFSLEMAKEQLVMRLLCMLGHINSSRLRTGFLAKEEFRKLQPAADKLSQAEIYIDETPSISVLELRSKARRHAATHNVDVIIIDYLQLMTSGRRAESRQIEIAEISRSIKALARELSVPVIALSQLSREAEKDDTGAPKLSHLRESGAIEQDADVVMMLSRPPAHKRDDDEGDEPVPYSKTIHLNIAKQRNGPTGSLDLEFDRDFQKFTDPIPPGRYGAPPPGVEQPRSGPAPPPPSSPAPPPIDAEDYDEDEDNMPF